ncbi:MAG: alpha/beta hydrolase [Actinomycetota bacterium]
MTGRRTRKRLAATLLAGSMAAGACANASPEELSARYGLDPAPVGDGSFDEPPAAETEQSPFEPRAMTETECPFMTSEYTVTCGTMSVSVPGRAANIDVAYAVFHSERREPEPDPVVYLHGGPGGQVVNRVLGFAPSIVDPFIADRDVVVFDQRGSGLSSPLPVCSEAWNQDDPFFASDRRHADITGAYVFDLGICADRMSRYTDIDLSQYNSATHAGDLIRLLNGLGYDNANLYGSSYGSRLAQTLVRDHPDRVRALILTGVYPIEQNLIGSVPQSFEHALTEIFDACADAAWCNDRLPDPFATLERAVADLDAEPQPVNIATPIGSSYELLFAGDELLELLHGLLYASYGAALIPDLLIELEEGNRERLRWLAPQTYVDNGAVVAHLAVQCHEEVPFVVDADLERSPSRPFLNRINNPPGLFGPHMVEICDLWPATEKAASVENESATWPQPTLLFAGRFDPITPAEWARQMAERLPGATLVEVDDRGHDAVVGPCAATLMAGFVDDPSAAPDVSCFEDQLGVYLNDTAIDDTLNTAKLVSSRFDVDPGLGVDWLDLDVPFWSTGSADGEEVYWRGVDYYDPTAIVIRSGPFDRDAVLAYLGYEPVEKTFLQTAVPPDVVGGWERRRYDTATLDIVSYITTEPFELNISVIAFADDLDDLERETVIPMLNSIVD